MGILTRDFKRGILNRQYVWGFCLGIFNEDFEW